MSAQALFFAIDVIGIFSILLLGTRVLISSPKQLNARLLALICFNSACAVVLARQDYACWIPQAYQLHVGLLRFPLHIARNLTSGILMLLCFSLFQDETKFPRWLIGAFALQILMEAGNALRSVAETTSQHDFLQVAPALLQLLFVGFALYWMLRGWRADLVEARRRLRLMFLVIVGVFIFAAILLERVFMPWEDMATFYVHVALSIFQTGLSVLALLMFRSGEPFYVDPFRGEKISGTAEASIVPVEGGHEPAIAAIQEAFTRHRLYRDGELTVASLAAKLKMPEYRLRKLIHEQLRFRNFNALLHHYRIAEACAMLVDPKNSLPILTIALTVGYNSINPFNRAFRDAKGMTPSAYRTQARGKSSVPAAENLAPNLEN
jgi:AraC-like DNA-binding protein